MLDAPCGDYNWFRLIVWKNEIDYIGGDIVKPLIESNQARYGGERTKFVLLDIVNDPLPEAELWICRDCLFHFSERDIMLTINNFLKSNIRYLLTTSHPDCNINHDIPTGSFRPLNLQLPPYSFGQPVFRINDWNKGWLAKHLVLWERETLKNRLALNKVFQSVVGQEN